MKLLTYLKVQNISIAAFGRSVDIRGRRTMHRIALGLCLPRRETMRRIYVATRGAVQPNDFYDLPELPTAGAAVTETASIPAAEAAE